jgi:AcrR family transcriptional regulator
MSVDEPEDGYEDAADLGLPEPPWQRTTKRRRSAPRPQLSRRAIVDAALRVLHKDGGDGLTMRRVADELGSGAASLYGYVANKEELIQLLLDRLLGELKIPEPDPAHWQDQIKDYMRQARELMQRHPGMGRLTLGRIPLGPRFMLQAEALFAILRGAGLPDWLCGYTGDLLGLYVGAFGYEQDIGHSFPSDEPMAEKRLANRSRTARKSSRTQQ